MFILDSLLIDGLGFVFDKIRVAAEAEEEDDEGRLREALLDGQTRLESGELSEDAYAALERDILERLGAARRRQRGDDRRQLPVTGVDVQLTGVTTCSSRAASRRRRTEHGRKGDLRLLCRAGTPQAQPRTGAVRPPGPRHAPPARRRTRPVARRRRCAAGAFRRSRRFSAACTISSGCPAARWRTRPSSSIASARVPSSR